MPSKELALHFASFKSTIIAIAAIVFRRMNFSIGYLAMVVDIGIWICTDISSEKICWNHAWIWLQGFKSVLMSILYLSIHCKFS